MNNILTNRHDILLFFDVANGNPNGDPDAGNMPRLNPNNNHGFVTDVCLKRKIRNYISLFTPNRDENGNGYNIFIRQGNVLNEETKKVIKENTKANNPTAEEAIKWICQEFYDIRTFGAVLSTGSDDDLLKGSAYGQVRGPIQVTFGQSLDPISPLEVTITRCAVTKEEDKTKERTMGNKHIVPYGLYAAKIYVSPAFAEKTGFTNKDLDIFFEALLHLFEHDRSASRGEMVVRGVYDFEHVGTQNQNNVEQNKREARVGCAHAHKLFEGIKISLKEGIDYPNSFEDYQTSCGWDNNSLPIGVRLHKRHEIT